MKHIRTISVIMVLALCFGAAQSVDAKKKKTRKRDHKTEKKQRVTTLTIVDDSDILDPPKSIECVEDECVEDMVLMTAAHMPEFPGGTAALMKFISNNLHYPQVAQDNGIQGKVVVQFVVEKDGHIGEVEVAQGVDKDLDKEAVRVCKILPKFNPGRNDEGDPVRVWYTLPIIFKLTGLETGPTGDYAYDAKQVGEEVIKILMRDISSEEDINQMEKDTDALQKKYEDFYKARGEDELKKFNEALDKLDSDPEFNKRFEEAKNKLMEKASKLQ